MIRVALPAHLRTLARVGDEVALDGLPAGASAGAVLDALEGRYPMLKGTLRDPASGRRRPFIRFFACGQDISHEALDRPLPEAIASGREPLLILGAIAGG